MILPVPEIITTQRLVLERLKHADAEEIFYTYASKPEATRYLSWPTHGSLKDTRRFLDYAVRSWELGDDYSFGIRLKSTHRLIGSFGLLNDHGKIQFGYVLSPTQWGQGYATEACKGVLPVISPMPGVWRIGTFVDADNVASANVLRKAGLVEEARLSQWFCFVNQGNEPKDCILFVLPR